MPILEGINITKKYNSKNSGLFRKEQITALDNVSFAIDENEIIGIVGESGSGKSTLGAILGDLQSPCSGQVLYKGNDIAKMNKSKYLEYRRNVQFIFQSPQESMNPHYKVIDVLMEPMKTLLPDFNEVIAKKQIVEMLDLIGLDESYLLRYPRSLSGGQAQRIAIGRALLLNPEIIIADEAVSALDVSVQAIILNLINDLRAKFKTSYIFISHDIAVINYISDKIFVLYAGNTVEYNTAQEVIRRPVSDYTKKIIYYATI